MSSKKRGRSIRLDWDAFTRMTKKRKLNYPVSTLIIPREGRGAPVGSTMKSKTRKRLNGDPARSLDKQRESLQVGYEVADASSKFDTLKDMIEYVIAKGKKEHWSPFFIRKVTHKLHRIYRQYNANLPHNEVENLVDSVKSL